MTAGRAVAAMESQSPQRTALICGVTGQDGSYLAQLLVGKGYKVWGACRDAQLNGFERLRALDIRDQVQTVSMAPADFRSVLNVVNKVRPNEIYNLAGQSSVALSFDQPVETAESITVGVLNLLEAIRFVDPSIRFYNAGSSEVFGDTGDEPANESSPFRPRSPYAVAKAASTWQVSVYRDSYDLFACTGILFNHESVFRPARYVTQKIVSAAARIASGSGEKLHLGNIDIVRDWGWAPEYVDAMWRILNYSRPQDFVIATGRSCSLREFVARAFAEVGLDWQEHVEHDSSLLRPSEILSSRADPGKAARLLGWRASTDFSGVIEKMMHSHTSGSGEADA